MMHERICKVLFDVFWKGVQSVQIPHLTNENIHYNVVKEILKVFNFDYNLQNKNVYVVGAGKAVLNMATELEKKMGSKILSGIVSVPSGALTNEINVSKSAIKFYEGAENNLPDERALSTTEKIMKLVEKLDEKCLLLVLLSGGGSSLLSAPIPPISLYEKSQLINNLAKAGADIIELNTVRKRLSTVKGGKLSLLAQPATVISLLLSDIVKNRADFIASGPTFPNCENSCEAMNIVKKYSLQSHLPSSIAEVLLNNGLVYMQEHQSNVANFVLGNNTIAVNKAKTAAIDAGYFAIFMSDCIQGDVDEISKQYCALVHSIIKYFSNELERSEFLSLMKTLNCLSLYDTFLEEIVNLNSIKDFKGLCLIGGGEPTVTVKGLGRGGRNQQLSLKFSLDIHNVIQHSDISKDYNFYMLSAGTDGIDGPTDAAGAIGYSQLINEARKQNFDVQIYLDSNDSYNFYNNFDDGKFHIKTGHTNTNVMDLHIIILEPKSSIYNLYN